MTQIVSPRDETAPIGVFDSGLGGLTVVREMLRQLPDERIVYVGDTINVPYGGRPLAEVEQLAIGKARFLVEDAGCRTVVMACNISSAVALDSVRAAFPGILTLGVIEPGARAAAAKLAPGGAVAVLATEGTVRSGAYSRALAAEAPGVAVTAVACPRFVPLVEAGQTETEDAEDAVCTYLTQARTPHEASVIVLGCTHYPFLLPALQRRAGPSVVFVDPAGETVRELASLLPPPVPREHDASDSPNHEFYATGDTDQFTRGARAFLGDGTQQITTRKLYWHPDGTLQKEPSYGSNT